MISDAAARILNRRIPGVHGTPTYRGLTSLRTFLLPSRLSLSGRGVGCPRCEEVGKGRAIVLVRWRGVISQSLPARIHNRTFNLRENDAAPDTRFTAPRCIRIYSRRG